MKALVGLHKNRFVDLEHVAELVAKPEDMQFAQDVADEAITLVRENGHVLPLKRGETQTARRASDGNAPQKPSLIVVLLAEAMESTNGHEFERK